MSLVVAAAKTDKGVAGGRRRRGGTASAFASAACPHPQCALPRKAFCIFAATCINVDKKLLPLQVPQCRCCWLLAARCCLLLPAVKTATSLCGKHLIVAHICAPNLVVQLELPLPPPQRLYLCLCLSLSFRWPFPCAIGKKRTRAERRQGVWHCQRAAVPATRCGKLAVGGWGGVSICRLPLLSLSAIISVLLWQLQPNAKCCVMHAT